MLVAVSGALTVIGAIIAGIGLSALCWLGWLIDLVSFGSLLFIAVWWARLAGCLPWPGWVPDRARVRLPDPLRFLCRR